MGCGSMADVLGGDFLLQFTVALGLGALVGIEREHRRDEAVIIAGVRTFPLFSISGYILGSLALAAGDAIILAVGLLLGGVVAVAFFLVRHRLGMHGLTTPMAMVVTFLVGGMIAYGFLLEAVVVGVATTFLLVSKTRLHAFAETLTDHEVLSALQFITVVFILFPLATSLTGPVHPSVPWLARGGLVDPYQVLLVVVFVATISFVSFVAMRVWGTRRGFEMSGLLGGLVNSEATAISLAHRARGEPALAGVAAVGALLATATMFARNVAIVAFAAGATAPALLPRVLPVAVAGALAAAAGALYLRSRARHEASEVGRLEVRNPFAVVEAAKFALVFTALAAAAKLLATQFGPLGVVATAIGGFAYAGAVVASVGTLAATGAVDADTAAVTVGLAMLAGAANKAFILRHESPDVQRRVLLPIAATVALGAVALAATVMWPA